MRIYKTRVEFTALNNTNIFPGTVCTITDEATNPMYVYQGGEWNNTVTATTDPVTGGSVFSSGDDGFGVYVNSIVPNPRTSAGINAAVEAIVAAGCIGTVLYEDAEYVIDAPINLHHGISHIGVAAKFAYGADVPENDMTITGGTRFNVSAGVTPFAWNNTDKGSDEVNMASFALNNCKFYGIVFNGGARGISFGALRAMGFTFCEFDELYGFNQTDRYSFDFNNFQYSRFGNIFSRNDLATESGGVRFSSRLSTTLYPGDSVLFGRIFVQTYQYLNRGIVFEVSGPAGCALNDMKVSGVMHCNRYGNPSTPATISMTSVSGTPDLSVSAGDFAKLPLGMPVVFITTAPTGIPLKTIHYVYSRNTGNNSVTLAETHYATAPVTLTSSGTYAATYSGFPAIEFNATHSSNAFTFSDFGMMNAAPTYGIVSLTAEKWRGSKGGLYTFSNSPTDTSLAIRDCDGRIEYSGTNYITQDQSALFGNLAVKNTSVGALYYSGGSFTLNSSYEGRTIRYAGTTDITITVPATLPRGFQFEIVTTGATGIVTFSPASGAYLFSKNGYRTNGQYAAMRMKNISNNAYSVTGDTQV